MIKVKDLQTNERNPRQIKGEKLELLKRSVAGFQKMMALRPIVVDETSTVLGGNMRLAAVRALGLKEIPEEWVKVAEGLTDEEKREFIIKDNAGFGEWDWDLLANEWDDLPLKDWGLDVPDFEKPDGTADAAPLLDKAEELNAQWQVKPGDVWQIGQHRLICADSTRRETVERLMGNELAHLLFTSPPYWVGMAYEYQDSEESIDNFIGDCVRAWTDNLSVECGRIVVNTGSAAIHRIDKKRKVEVLPLIDKWQAALKQRGWIARHFRIWAKSGDFPASIAPKSDVVDQRWEHIVTFTTDEYEYMTTFWAPAGKQRGQERTGMPWAQQGVWSDIQGDRSAGGKHIAAFPVELPYRYLKLYSKRGEIVLEPFCGSGTTLVACENTGRIGRAIEKSPEYCAVILQRMQEAFPAIEIKKQEQTEAVAAG